ncbi:MAG: cellulase family glycosylhydrolase [Chloroflexota bacterium]
MKRIIILLTIFILAACSAPQPLPATVTPDIPTSFTPTAVPSAFLRVQGHEIVDSGGQPVYLRGVNMDTYYYSYIWNPDAAWDYATQEDIKYLESIGATAIRLGFHWRYLDTSLGFDLIDTYLDWCEQAGIYVILDMHVVPPEDDILQGRMWDDPAAQQQFLDLWTSIAARYVDRTIIAGYDLYNEPAPPSAAQWWDLARRSVAAIRSVDRNHILFVETPLLDGVTFELLPDPNVVYSFHNYSPMIVSHAAADWVGDSLMPDDYSYPGPVLASVEWADWSQDAAELTDQTDEWIYWDSGPLTAPEDVEFATVKPAAWGDIGQVWFDDLELEINGVTQSLHNPAMEEASAQHANVAANWRFWSDSDFTGEWSAEYAHSGSHSLEISGNGDGWGMWTQSEWILIEPLFRVQAGDTLRVRGWVYAPQNNGGGVSLGLDYLNGVYEEYNREHLLADIQPYLEWGAAHDVPLFVGEFGSMSAAPGDSRYALVSDMISVMNENGLHWTMWSFRSPERPGFAVYFGGELDERMGEILQQGLQP